MRIIHPDARLVAGLAGGAGFSLLGPVRGSDPGTPAVTENLKTPNVSAPVANARPPSPACQTGGVCDERRQDQRAAGPARSVVPSASAARWRRRPLPPRSRTREALPRRSRGLRPGRPIATMPRRFGKRDVGDQVPPRLDLLAVGQDWKAAHPRPARSRSLDATTSRGWPGRARRCSPRPPAPPTLLRESRCRLAARLTDREGRFSVVPERTRLGG